jgi:glutamyl-tRNA reductase
VTNADWPFDLTFRGARVTHRAGDADALSAVRSDPVGSLRHLLGVAAEVDSRVTGDGHVLGQVRWAADRAVAELADRFDGEVPERVRATVEAATDAVADRSLADPSRTVRVAACDDDRWTVTAVAEAAENTNAGDGPTRSAGHLTAD